MDLPTVGQQPNASVNAGPTSGDSGFDLASAKPVDQGSSLSDSFDLASARPAEQTLQADADQKVQDYEHATDFDYSKSPLRFFMDQDHAKSLVESERSQQDSATARDRSLSNAFLFDVPSLIENHFFPKDVDKEKALEKAHPIASDIGDALGTVTNMIVGAGPAKAGIKAGAKGATKIAQSAFGKIPATGPVRDIVEGLFPKASPEAHATMTRVIHLYAAIKMSHAMKGLEKIAELAE